MVEITGGSPERVEVNLRVAAGELTQVFEQISGVERFNDYIGWVNRHVRMLAGQVSQRDIDDLLQTRGYWSLRGGDPVTLGNNLAETIRREIEYQRHALLLAADEIRSERQRWDGKGKEPVALILDTGVLEHNAEELDTADWHMIGDVHPHRFLYLVVTRVVLDEIDRHKQSRDNGSQAKARRAQARAAIRALWAMFGTGERAAAFSHTDGILAREGRFELLNDSIEHHQLADPDAELLDRSSSLRAYVEAKVVTFDIGLALRGKAAGIDVLLLRNDTSDEEAADGFDRRGVAR
ncbi:PIN domain-containing protein [Rathayibacter sp. KR2-224]|uniref:PIN domain-containing protein n=1 Tax=Rathayibacter sp. KR2-224 TaxID=3400913 RepID=UPI003C09A0F6